MLEESLHDKAAQNIFLGYQTNHDTRGVIKTKYKKPETLRALKTLQLTNDK